MKCEQIKELILTDYIDGRMTASAKEGLEKHLMACHDCLEFARVAKAMAVEPFEKMPREKTPENVWMNIKEKITAREESVLMGWLEKIRDIFRSEVGFSRPVMAFAGTCLVVMAIGLVHLTGIDSNFVQMVEARQQEETEYMLAMSLSTPESEAGYGSNVEQYFL